jgi:hypothetical protein
MPVRRLFSCLPALVPATFCGMTRLLALLSLLVTLSLSASAEVLIVADEFPAMEVVAAKLKAEEQIDSKIISQKDLPGSLSAYQAVLVYIHRDLSEKAEDAFIDYAKQGGRLVVLHHSISSGKRKNPHWFPFLGVSLPEGDLSQGGYKWITSVTIQIVELNHNHFITTNKVVYPQSIQYATTNAAAHNGMLPGFTRESEVYLNHVHTEPHTLLLGIKYTDANSGKTYMQDTAGWLKPADKGWVVYLMPGHTKQDFEDPAYSRIVVNAVTWKAP